MSDNTRSVLSLIVVLMYAVSVILFFINLFDNSYGDAQSARIKIFCGLMVGASILAGILKATGNNDDNNANDDSDNDF